MNFWNGTTKLTTKRGRYGGSKIKAFSVLNEIAPDQYLPVRQLCLMSGIDYYSLGRALPRWVIFKYVSRFPTTSIGQGDYGYRLLTKGKSWLKLAESQLPNAPVFLKELEVWQRDVMDPETLKECLALPFDAFVRRLHELIRISNIRTNDQVDNLPPVICALASDEYFRDL